MGRVDYTGNGRRGAVSETRLHDAVEGGFGETAVDYALHESGFPDTLFERLVDRGVYTAGDRVLDFATGTGNVARALALRGCRAVALDPSVRMLDEALRLAHLRRCGQGTKEEGRDRSRAPRNSITETYRTGRNFSSS